MAVKKKVASSIESVIDKGASVKANGKERFKNILIRMPQGILNELDERIERKPWLNRTQWIVEAIHEKLKSGNDERRM
jgi:hypothetical protein